MINMSTCKYCKEKYENKCHAPTIYCSIQCRTHDPEWINKQRMAKLGKTAWNKGLPAPWANWEVLMTKESRKKMAQSKKGKPSPQKGKPFYQLRGKNNPQWKGGSGTERHRLRGQVEYKLWRQAVFARDDWTCQTCFIKGGKLEADHIKPWSLYPALRYAIDNGRTLCISCHRQTDTWGARIFRQVERVKG